MATAVAGLCAPAWAAEGPTGEVLEVPEVVVEGRRSPFSPLDPRRVPANVTVITGDEIRRSGAQTVPEALQRVPGIAIFETYGNRQQQTMQMRGFSGLPVPEVNVLVDGVPANVN